jgi:hypothetical protein
MTMETRTFCRDCHSVWDSIRLTVGYRTFTRTLCSMDVAFKAFAETGQA